ncbi:MAG: class I SAM-dependent methyltransferase [Acidobacteriota bacterium]
MARIRSYLASHPQRSGCDVDSVLSRDQELRQSQAFLNLNYDTSRVPRSVTKARRLVKMFLSRLIFFHTSQQVEFNRAVGIAVSRLIESLQEDIRRQQETIRQLREQTEKLQMSAGRVVELLEQFERIVSQAEAAHLLPAASWLSDAEYGVLQERFRGGARTEPYAQYLQSIPKDRGPILEIGAGSGAFLEACVQAGYEAFGLETNASMVSACRQRNLNVFHEDALAFLTATTQTFGAIVALQVLEHWDSRYLGVFLELAHKRLNPGGVFVMETINPTSVLASCNNFYRDPTHKTKLHPETLAFLFERFGYATRLIWLSPVPEKDLLGGRDTAVLKQADLRKLNQLLYGFQDYALIARKPPTE